MPMMEVNLPQLLKAIEQLNPAELAILQERIHRTQHAAPVKTSPKTAQRDEFFTLPFTEYLALPDEERERIQFSVYQSQKKWIDAELERRSAEWILVCGGEVVEASETLRNYPSREKLMALGKARGVVPFVFVKAPLVEEESAWAALPHADFYPTLSIMIGLPECTHKEVLKMLSTHQAIVHNGEIRLLEPVNLPEGAKILLTILQDDQNDFWMAASQSSLDKVWGNSEDDIYEQLLER